MKDMTAVPTEAAQKKTGMSRTSLLRMGLMFFVALCAIILLGADHPEDGTKNCILFKTAASLCEELAPEMRPEMKRFAAQNPAWVLQVLAE